MSRDHEERFVNGAITVVMLVFVGTLVYAYPWLVLGVLIVFVSFAVCAYLVGYVEERVARYLESGSRWR